jgi:hypothetical protein
MAVYAVTGTSVLPAVASLLAQVDGGHGVAVQVSEHGTRLSLRHRQSEATPAVADHGSAAGRLVTRLCRNDASGNHELLAGQVSPIASLERDLLKKAAEAPAPALNAFESLLLEWLPARSLEPEGMISEREGAPAARPAGGFGEALATVQLLI